MVSVPCLDKQVRGRLEHNNNNNTFNQATWLRVHGKSPGPMGSNALNHVSLLSDTQSSKSSVQPKNYNGRHKC